MSRLAVFQLIVVLGVTLAGNDAVAQTATNQSTAAVPAKVHALRPGDVVEIKVYRHADLDTRTRLSGDGTIVMPLLGSIKAVGLTAEQARGLVRDLLEKDYLVNPQVSLSVVEYAKNLFTVMGEVQKPGAYELSPEQGVNLLQAIAMAGGYTRLGSPAKVIVQRTVEGQKRVFKLDTTTMTSSEKGVDFEILPGDIIAIGEKLF